MTASDDALSAAAFGRLRHQYEHLEALDVKLLQTYLRLRDQYHELRASGDVWLRAYRRLRERYHRLTELIESTDGVLMAIADGEPPSLEVLGRLPHQRAVWLARIAVRAGVVEPTFWGRLASRDAWSEVNVGAGAESSA